MTPSRPPFVSILAFVVLPLLMQVQLQLQVALASGVSSESGVGVGVGAGKVEDGNGWEVESRAAPNTAIQFLFALKQQHLDVLEQKFWAVSDPNSDQYQKFMTIDEVLAIIAPKSDDVNFIVEWLNAHGAKAADIQSLGDALEVTTTVEVAEKLFSTEFYHFTHKQWKKTVLHYSGSFSVPQSIRSRVDLIAGEALANFPQLNDNTRYRRYRGIKHGGDDGGDGVIPQTSWNLYSVGPQTFGNATSITSQGVIEFDDNTFSSVDLMNFASQVEIKISELSADHIVGNNYDEGTDEANLDIQTIAGVNTEATNWFWIEDDIYWLYTFATHFFNTTDVPLVVSISYGWWEGDQCETGIGDRECKALNVTSADYVARVNTEFQKIGLRGVSIIVASGDNGAHTWSDEMCEAPQLRVEFPASSPFVTSVGATQITNGTPMKSAPPICSTYGGCVASGTEVAVSYPVAGFASGGGFSAFQPQPSYQVDVVKAYLTSGVPLPPSSMYNISGRAHPDISAVGHNNLIWMFAPELIGGTSASAPIVAAIVSMLNQASIANSGKPLGFVNPLLYQIYSTDPAAFNDITVGDNFCTGQAYYGCSPTCTGFNATKGWDPVTGLGTLNYGALLKHIQKQKSQSAKLMNGKI